MLMVESIAAVKYRLPIKVVVLKNNTLGQIKWEQMMYQGNPEFGCELQSIDFAAFARACGGVGYAIDDPATCGEILDRTLAEPGSVIIDAIVDPLEPQLPAKLKPEEVEKFSQALKRGELSEEIAANIQHLLQVREMV